MAEAPETEHLRIFRTGQCIVGDERCACISGDRCGQRSVHLGVSDIEQRPRGNGIGGKKFLSLCYLAIFAIVSAVEGDAYDLALVIHWSCRIGTVCRRLLLAEDEAYLRHGPRKLESSYVQDRIASGDICIPDYSGQGKTGGGGCQGQFLGAAAETRDDGLVKVIAGRVRSQGRTGS